MDNQKTQQGNGSNIGNEGSGSSMGKDLGGTDHTTSKSAGFGNLDRGIDKSASDLHEGIDKAAESAQPMADRLASSAHAGVDKMSTALTGASARLDEKSKQLGEAYGRFAETGRDYVRTSPATSVLIALAAGFTLSKLLGRRH
jgi:ElaB/YqjD/DUF883 family membrane-anchored ribosome-binding protein